VQLIDARIGYLWFVAPNVLVDQAHVRHGTVETAHALHDWIDRLQAARRADIDAAGGLVAVHDWRSLRGYDAPARRAYQDRMRARPKGYLQAAYVVVPSTPLLRMAVEAGNLAAQIGSGGRVALAADPSELLARLGVQRPASTASFPGR
jgi:hypothetical protein